MLNVLRESFKQTPILKIVLATVGASMVLSLGYYFVSPSGGAAGGWVARVNGEQISFQDYLNRARLVDGRYRELLGDAYDQFRQPERIAQEAIESLVRDALVRQDADRLGLSTSKEELAELIFQNPQFQNDSGQFIGKDRYYQLLGGKRGAESYEARLTDALVSQRWHDFVGQAVTVDAFELEEFWRRRNERTRIDHVIVPAADQRVDEKVTDEQVRNWYDEHAEDYRREESRKIRFVTFDRESLEATIEVTDEAIQEYYASNESKYSHPEQRRARHILFRIPPTDAAAKSAAREQAEKALERAKAGEDFAALARELSQDPVSAERGGDLGFFASTDMVEPFSNAAFSTAVGELAPVTESPFGWHVIQVTGAREQGVTPLEEVREEIRGDLVAQQAQDRVLDEAQRVRDAIGEDLSRFAEVAEAEGLEIQSRTVVGRERLADIGATPQFAVSVSQLEAGTLSQALPLTSGMALVAVDEVLPPAVAPLEEVRDRVVSDVLTERRRQSAMAAGRAALDKHLDFAEAAKQLGLEVKSSGELAPGQNLPGTGGAVPELQDRLFGDHVMIGSRGVIALPTGALVYEVASRVPFDAEAFENGKTDMRRQMLASRRAQYGQEVVTRLRETQSIEIDYDAISLN